MSSWALPGLPPDGPIAVILIVAFGIACAFAFVIWID